MTDLKTKMDRMQIDLLTTQQQLELVERKIADLVHAHGLNTELLKEHLIEVHGVKKNAPRSK